METQTKAARRGPKPNPNTRDNLMRVGVQMLHEAGYTATGIKDIVDAAHVPKGSFYNHFESKEAFGKEVVDFYFDGGLVELRARLCDDSIPPIDRLRGYFDERIRGFQATDYVRGCMLGNLSLEVADHSVPIRDRLAAHFGTWSGLFEACIAEAQSAGAISNRLPAPLLAEFLLNSWEGALLRMRVEKSDEPLRAFVEVAFGSLLI
ncbi:transcriptional regulator, TetR family [Rhizobium leguminosarum bv. trifolii WSM2304]|uniref:Transcriptional regulator, TetR family n=1 Tax=Rhizobium leguminosarum bv. trifolii (strain WSM2304) TaxID=395492 RepID=A0ABF7QIG9_RHILW|nr:TetR/AcrR family transcriptional regulator [Rhizobium leguminosarum]ACI53778.1 transcriptional regulator, TetR family [Rhizobium leguminosarum bv. trifolii WSM2304]